MDGHPAILEIVQVAIEAWNRGDFDAWIGAWDERAEFHPLRARSEGRAYRGHDGLRRLVAELAQEWEQVRFESMRFGMPESRSWRSGAYGHDHDRAALSGMHRLRSSGSCGTGSSSTRAAQR
jgi:hypothetical protein